MSDWRELVRVAIIETIKNESWVQFENTKKLVENEMNEHSSRIPGYKEDARINIELVVPIQLPPNGKKGDCKRVVKTVQDQFIELSGGEDDGGAQIYLTNGSWVSSIDGLNEDQCLIVYTAMPAKSWHKAIPVLRDLIKDEIQGKLLQQCVFIRIDGIPHGGPINLLKGDKLASDVKSAAGNFGGVDSSCYTLVLKEYSELIEKMNDNMSIEGNKNVQISSKGKVTSAVGSGSMAAGGNLTVNQSGVPMMEVAEMIANEKLAYKQLELELEKSKNSKDEDIQKIAAKKAVQIFEEMKKEQKTNFKPWKLIEIGNAAQLAGNLELAEGNYKQACRKYKLDGNREGEANSLNNLGIIAQIRGDLAEEERLHRESLVIKREIGDRGGEAHSLNSLGIIAQRRGDLAEAERLYRDCLAIGREIGDRAGEAASLGNLGNIAKIRGDLAEAERLLLEAKSVYQEIGDRAGVSRQLGNLGNIAKTRGDLAEAERLREESLAIKREIGIPIDDQ